MHVRNTCMSEIYAYWKYIHFTNIYIYFQKYMTANYDLQTFLVHVV